MKENAEAGETAAHRQQGGEPRPSARADAGTLVASLAQRALWLLGKTLSDQAVYNEPNVYRRKGRLDLEALAKAINEVVRRHESLRTRFCAEGSEVLQLIDSELVIPVPVTDLRAMPASARDTEARSRA